MISSPQVVEPQSRHEMKRHAGFSTVLSPGTQAHGALAPVGRITRADRIAATAVFLDARFAQYCEECIGDVLARIAGLRGGKARFDAFDDGLFRFDEMLRRPAEIHRARLRTVVALEATGDFEERARVRRERGIVPREMGAAASEPVGNSGTMAG